MGWLMEPIYFTISWILLRWHWVWDAILPNGQFLGTTWDWVLAIVFLVITVRVVLFPIFVKQIRSQRAMQALQPKMKELQAKHKGDQQTLREEMMKLYQSEKVNPLMGCLPLLLQIPVFLGLFHVLNHVGPYLDNGTPMPESGKTLYGWTVPVFDSAAQARLFNAPISARFADSSEALARLDASGATVKIVAGVLVLIMMITTFLTSRQMILKTGWSQDPQQRMIQRLMLYGIPFSLLLSGWYFPIGVIIYWVTQNLFSLGQQFWVLHKYPPPVTEGNIPMKRAREADQPGWLARFVQVKPAEPKPTTRTGFLNNQGQPSRGGLFRRRRIQAAEPVTPEPRSLAPRVGAKPLKQTLTTKPAEAASSNGGDASAPPTPPEATPPAPKAPAKAPAPGTAVKSTPAGTGSAAKSTAKAKGSPAAPNGSTGAPSGGASAGTSGGASAGTPPAPASGGTSGAAKATSGARAGTGSGGGRPAAKKTGNRKGQPNRKGGAKR